jgi:UDP:flavonoid glycosyltransferase YjiC (YdhE family)
MFEGETVRFLFIAGGGSATIHASAPLASAARTAGHEVIVACPEENLDLVIGLGLPAQAVTPVRMIDAMLKDRQGNWLGMPSTEDEEMDFAGRGFARLAAASCQATVELADAWAPDLVIGGEYNHSAPLIAHRFDIPFVRHTWAIYDRTEVDWQSATDELKPELSQFGLDAVPDSDMFVDITPPSVRQKDAEPAQAMRWTPGNQQVPLQPWMYSKGDRPRVVITSGSRSMFVPMLGAEFFRRLLSNPVLSGGDVEVVLATSEPVAAELRAEFPDIKAGYVPLDVLAPTADLAVHHGGGVTVMTLLNAGTPQLALPTILAAANPMRRVDQYGASITMATHTEPAEDIAAAVTKILSDSQYKDRARGLAEEIAGLPAPAEVVKAMESLV